MKEFITKANSYGYRRTPFFFLIDFEMKKPFICSISEAQSNGLYFVIKSKKNFELSPSVLNEAYCLEAVPISRNQYTRAFALVKDHLKKGNSFLLNLTFPTNLDTDISLKQIFQKAHASYKLYREDDFVIFSPECFVKIQDDHIYAYPMKGTIDASVPNAEQCILLDDKERWEHNTIVDLIRNDLSMVSKNIVVERFRYIDRIKTDRRELLQVSSEIRGNLADNWQSNIGNMLIKLLPAGSISGAPKQKTVEIIREAEGQERGYYTGIFGIFDGQNLDSAVNIRYIEQTDKGLRYRSGGGITALSDEKTEYQELLDKVYVPLD